MPVPPSARGPAWMLVACVVFAVMWMIIRVASRSVHPFEIVFFRNFFGFVILLPMLLRTPGLIRWERRDERTWFLVELPLNRDGAT